LINFSLNPKDSPVTNLNGPGKRIALWVQGCSIRCTDQCIAWQSLSVEPHILMSVEDVLEMLLKRFSENPDVEGITLLGGEPTDQARSLYKIARKVRQWRMSVMTYSGHTWDHLKATDDQYIKKLLSETDLLKAGPYDPLRANAKLLWRGSYNQTLHILSDHYSYETIKNSQVIKGADISISSDGHLVISGCQDRQVIQSLLKKLKEKKCFLL